MPFWDELDNPNNFLATSTSWLWDFVRASVFNYTFAINKWLDTLIIVLSCKVLEARLGTIIHGQLDQLERDVLFTEAFVARQMACIRGVFSAIIKYLLLSTNRFVLCLPTKFVIIIVIIIMDYIVVSCLTAQAQCLTNWGDRISILTYIYNTSWESVFNSANYLQS